MTRILIASVTAANERVLRSHIATIRWQKLPPDVSVDLFYAYDPTSDAKATLESEGVECFPAPPKPANASYAVSDDTHHWSVPTFHWLAQAKQKILDHAREKRYDAVWLVDSDLLCDPTTLASLLACEKPIVSAVFWTKWQPDAPLLPQVWLRHPYEMNDGRRQTHEFLGDLYRRRLVPVAGLGACTLIRADVLDRVRFWPLVDGLPQHSMWQGEDRHFCVTAARNHVSLWADAWPDIFHVYRPQDEFRMQAWLEQASLRRSDLCASDDPEDRAAADAPWIGDWVSFTVETMHEPVPLKEHVRGRLGQVRVLPEIEAALADMRVGDDRLVTLRYPLWYDIPAARGRETTLRVRLLDVKPCSLRATTKEPSPASIATTPMEVVTS